MPAAGSQSAVRRRLAADEAGAKLLISDLRVAYLLINEARNRTLERLLGVSREQANMVTLVALLMLAEGSHGRAQRLRDVQGPSRLDTMLGAAVLREAIYGIGGAAADETRMFGVLIALAVVGRLSVPSIRRAIHGASTHSRRARSYFNHRYGHLIPRPARPDRVRRYPPEDRGRLLESELADLS
jgi:hypothetical protein